MASKFLAMNYDDIQKAVKDTQTVRDDFQGEFNNINSAVDNLGASFKGKGGKSFLNWWNGSGKQHSQAIMMQMDKLDEKILKIMKLSQDTDDETAALIISNMKG
jgi:WXG100 family type VII secretion target